MLDGWLELTPTRLEDYRAALTPEDLAQYFDGQEPEWRHALAPGDQIPRRPVAVDGLAHLSQPAAESQALVLLVGPDGTGKSTALRQMACDLVAQGRRVLFRSPGAHLDPTAVAELPGSWVLVSDDANEIAHEVEKAIERLFAADRQDVRWLLSAREADWKGQFLRYGRSLEPAWERFAELWPALGNRSTVLGVGAPEAATVVAAWARAGALGALAAVADDDRAAALEDRSAKKLGISDGTLLGGSLELRYGAAGLPAFVERAGGPLPGPAEAAFRLAAAADVAGVDGVDLLVLADLTGVDRVGCESTLLAPLCRAGLASGSAGALRPRHRALAQEAVRSLADGRLGGDLEEVFLRLVRGTATTGNDVKSLAAGGAIMNCGPFLSEKLGQLSLPRGRCDQVACAVADEAERALPEFLLFSVARARTYQQADQPDGARQVLRARFLDATAKRDWEMVGRSYLYELSGAETAAQQCAEGAALAGLALADADGLGQLLMADAKVALLALGSACVELAGRGLAGDEGNAVFRRQLRSCAHLGEKVTPKWDQRARFDFHALAVAADDYAIPKTSAAEALLWLGQTVTSATGRISDGEVKELVNRLLPDNGTLTLAHLEETIGLGKLPWAKE